MGEVRNGEGDCRFVNFVNKPCENDFIFLDYSPSQSLSRLWYIDDAFDGQHVDLRRRP